MAKEESKENNYWSGLITKVSFGRFLFYFVTLAVLLIIYFRFSELKLIGSLFAGSNLIWLLAIIFAQLSVYYFQALNYRDVLRIKDMEVRVGELYPMSFVVQFFNQALPSVGLSGQVFFVQYLKRYGLAVDEGIGRAFLEIMTLWMAMGSFFITSSIMVFQGGAIANVPELRYVIYFFAFLAVIAVSLFFIAQRRRRSKISKWVVDWLHRHFENKKGKNHEVSNHMEMAYRQFKDSFNFGLLKKKAKAFWMAYFWQCMIIMANIVTLYLISFAIGHPIGFRLAFIVFSLVKFIGMIAFIPGAIGIFEGSMTLILISFGLAAGPALAMTLLLRAFTFWFPMPIGWALYQWYFLQYKLERVSQEWTKN